MAEKGVLNIYDIAKAAGVSIATVSRALSGAENVRPATRQRVLDVVEKTKYTPNAFARGLGLGSMKMVGILCTDVSDPFYARAVSMLERELRRLGLDALLYCTGSNIEDKQRYTSHLLAKHVDSIVLVGSAFKEQTDNSHIETAARQVPVVIINGLVECGNTYCVLCDEQQAMYDNVCLLHRHGCNNIAVLYHAASYSSAQKLAGYHDALCHCGLAQSDKLAAYCDKTCESAEKVCLDLLERYPEIDAIVTAEDLLAVGAGKALSKLCRSLPVIGFDNSVFSVCATPAITSVDNMLEDMCTTAAGILSTVLAGNCAPNKTLLQAKLVERETFRISK